MLEYYSNKYMHDIGRILTGKVLLLFIINVINSIRIRYDHLTLPIWQLKKEGQKKKEEAAQRGWFGGWFGGGKKEEKKEEDKDISKSEVWCLSVVQYVLWNMHRVPLCFV